MAHYSFLRDLKDSMVAVSLIAEKYRSLGYTVEELDKKSQHLGDLKVYKDGAVEHHEVKFDIMAADTNNLCFEVANSKGELTGIASTHADVVDYVVPAPDRSSFRIFKFSTEALRNYLYDANNASKVRQVNGGDKKKYSMILCSISTIETDNVALSVEVVSLNADV